MFHFFGIAAAGLASHRTATGRGRSEWRDEKVGLTEGFYTSSHLVQLHHMHGASDVTDHMRSQERVQASEKKASLTWVFIHWRSFL